MRAASVDDVVAYIVEKNGSVTSTELHPLLYYCQGWSLAWDKQPLFTQDIRAGIDGPIVHDVFTQHHRRYNIDSWSNGDSNALSAEQKETIDMVLEGYGFMPGQVLSDEAQSEYPWLEARARTSPHAVYGEVLSIDLMRDYFTAVHRVRG